MDISKTNSAYNLSLLDYLNKGKTGYFDGIAQNIMNTIGNSLNAAAENSADSGVNITLSEDAQKLLAQGNADNDGKLTGVKKNAQNFLMSFFDQSGLDLDNLSPEALDLINGLSGVIADSPATGRDMSTDAAENRYANGNRQAYTLTGNGVRLRIAVDYANGVPQKLSVTDITGGQVETAEITLTPKDGDDEATMTIARTQKSYSNGHMTTLDPIDPLTVDLYKA